MCRIIYGCINMDGEILSGSNGEDPALDFFVEKTEGSFEISYKTPFNKIPSLTFTPNYGKSIPTHSNFERRLGNLILVSNELKRFKLRLVLENNAIEPQDFSFIAIK